jgi:hypothetical protein
MYKPSPNLNLDARVAVIEEMVGELHQGLLGNGQVGSIKLLENRLDALEHLRSRVHGVVVFFALVGTLGSVATGVNFLLKLFRP